MMNIKEKLTPELLCGLGLMAVGFVQTVLTGKQQEYNQQKMKDEIKNDVIKSLSEKNQGNIGLLVLFFIFERRTKNEQTKLIQVR